MNPLSQLTKVLDVLKFSHAPESHLKKWRDEFLQSKRVAWAPNTARCYSSIINLYIAHVGDDHWPPTREGILDWLNQVKAGSSEVTAATYWRHLRAWLNYLEALDVLDLQSNPVHKIKKLRLHPREPGFEGNAFSKQELDQLFHYLENAPASLATKRDLALLRLQYITGCRSGEVAAITFDDLELTEGLPAIKIRARNSKTNESRTVYINHQAKEDLVKWFEALQQVGYSGQAVFPTLYNGIPGENALQAVGIYQMLQRRLKEAKLPPRRAHSLRHASARHALAKGIDLRKIRDQLGHSSISVTAKYLSGHDPDRAEAYNNWEQ